AWTLRALGLGDQTRCRRRPGGGAAGRAGAGGRRLRPAASGRPELLGAARGGRGYRRRPARPCRSRRAPGRAGLVVAARAWTRRQRRGAAGRAHPTAALTARSPCRTAAVRTIGMMAWTRCRRFGSEDAGPTTAGDDSGQGKPRLAQGCRQGDQRQAYQGGRVLAADGGEQADAQPLALEAAGAIVGLLG